jgi:hypothetical protein
MFDGGYIPRLKRPAENWPPFITKVKTDEVITSLLHKLFCLLNYMMSNISLRVLIMLS